MRTQVILVGQSVLLSHAQGAFFAVGKNSHDFLNRSSISVLLFKLVLSSLYFTITRKFVYLCGSKHGVMAVNHDNKVRLKA